jgi:hypothetical protein
MLISYNSLSFQQFENRWPNILLVKPIFSLGVLFEFHLALHQGCSAQLCDCNL